MANRFWRVGVYSAWWVAVVALVVAGDLCRANGLAGVAPPLWVAAGFVGSLCAIATHARIAAMARRLDELHRDEAKAEAIAVQLNVLARDAAKASPAPWTARATVDGSLRIVDAEGKLVATVPASGGVTRVVNHAVSITEVRNLLAKVAS